MASLTAQQLLNAWELGLDKTVLQKSLILLAAVSPGVTVDDLLTLSVGQRDLRLLQLREALFGQQLFSIAKCPQCHEQIEWESRTSEFILTSDLQGVDVDRENNLYQLSVDNYSLRFSLPNSLDMVAVLNEKETLAIEQRLLSRCVIEAKQGDTSCSVDQLPDTIIDAVVQQIESLDPQADIRINLNCSRCAHCWDVLFDIVSFLCTEVNAWAEKTLEAVYRLAVGFGWNERDILNLSPTRRQIYLGILGS